MRSLETLRRVNVTIASFIRSYCIDRSKATLDTKALNSYVNDASNVSAAQRSELSKYVQEQRFEHELRARLLERMGGIHIERITRHDPNWNVGDIVKFSIASFTKVLVLQGKKAGQIAWKSSDEAIIVIDRATRGWEIDYDLVTVWFSASEEKEVLVLGQYRVIDKQWIVEPGTVPRQKFKVLRNRVR